MASGHPTTGPNGSSSTSATTQAVPQSIIHPTTGQLMAPGSRVWPYFVDHQTFGRQWIGPKAEYSSRLVSASPATQQESLPAEGRPRMSNALAIATQTAEPITDLDAARARLPSIDASTISSSSQGDSGTLSLLIGPSAPRGDGTDMVDARYIWLLEQKTKLLHKGRLEESNLIQAAINVGNMLGWNQRDVLIVVQRLENVIASGDGTRILRGPGSGKMMEVVGEIGRIGFNGRGENLREIREAYKGMLYDEGLDSFAHREDCRRAPGLLMVLQAAINVAFLKAYETQSFDKAVFKRKAALFFRTPTKACGEERTYLLQMSKLGTRKLARKVAACPGIERAVKNAEKKTILESVKDQIPGGGQLINWAAQIFEEHSFGAYDEIIGMKVAAEKLGDDGVLALEYVYRKKVGFPILVGDGFVGGEEEEEEESDSGEDELRAISTRIAQLQNMENSAMNNDKSRLSLVIRLKVRQP